MRCKFANLQQSENNKKHILKSKTLICIQDMVWLRMSVRENPFSVLWWMFPSVRFHVDTGIDNQYFLGCLEINAICKERFIAHLLLYFTTSFYLLCRENGKMIWKSKWLWLCRIMYDLVIKCINVSIVKSLIIKDQL